MINQEVEPVAIFPDEESLDLWSGRDNILKASAFDIWVEKNGEALRRALSADTLTQEAAIYRGGEHVGLRRVNFRARILRKFPDGSVVGTVLQVDGYDPKDQQTGYGFGKFVVQHYSHYTSEYEQPEWAYGNEFEQLEILPEGMGIRLRKRALKPHTVTYIDPLGSITTTTHKPFISR